MSARQPVKAWRRLARSLTAALALALAAGSSAAATAGAERYDPALRFRTKTTAHFVIYYHAGEERLAARLAVVAEDVHRDMVARMGSSPSAPTHLVLVDQHDVSNGFATTLPRNTIEVAAVWPPVGSFIGNTDDWLRLVVAHEYAHIVHLDRSGGWLRALRRVFGRTPLAMPNLFVPAWQIEGLATFEETAATGRGRLVAQDFMDLIDLPAASGRPLPIDRAGGGLIRWPGGHASYAFGAGFHDFLVRRFGRERVAEYHRRAAASLYFTAGRHARSVFGQSFNVLWTEFLAERGRRASTVPAVGPQGRRITWHGFVVNAPRFSRPSPDGTGPAPVPTGPWPSAEIVYASADADRFPALLAISAGGSDAPRRLRDQFQTTGLAAVGDLVLFDQIEVARNVALRGDLHLLDRAVGQTWRLSTGARLVEPDLSPDGKWVAAIRIADGRRELVTYRLDRNGKGHPSLLPEPVLVLRDEERQYGTPRWSPDGHSITATRQRLLGAADLVVVEPPSAVPRVVLSRTGCRIADPAWMPDSQTVIAASDCAGGGFSLFAVDTAGLTGLSALDGVRLVLSVSGGARAPDVSSDGRWLTYVGATEGGADLFVVPVDPAAWPATSVFASDPGEVPTATGTPTDVGPTADPPYSPWPTVLPSWWFPTASADDGRTKLGAGVTGSDVLGYHRYDAAVSWWAERAGCSECAGAAPADWSAAYRYSRWTPTLFASVSRRTRLLDVGSLQAGREVAHRREDTWTAGLTWPRVRVRTRIEWLASIAAERVAIDTASVHWSQSRPSLRFAWSLVSARRYGYSVSPEDGVALAVTSEQVRPELGAEAAAGAATAEVRGYLRLGSTHGVLAARLAGGRSWGDTRLRRQFVVGGSGETPRLGAFGSDALDLLRGTGAIARVGTRVAVSNVDLRWPVARIERGIGLLPVFVRTLHAAAFVDAGQAWTKGAPSRDAVVSAGLELSADAVLGFGWPLTATAGLAWVREGAAAGWPRRPAGFVRLGYAF